MEQRLDSYQYLLIHAVQTGREQTEKHRWYQSERCWNCERPGRKERGKRSHQG